MPSKSTRHHKPGIWPEEDEEEPMTIARAQKQQRRAMTKAKTKSGTSSFFFLSFITTLP
jgi:uncharacterized protein YmfQ (DUF2313 family)